MKRLLAVLGITLVILGVTYVARPAAHVPPYDANLTRLAENELEAYCAGLAFVKSTSQTASAVNAEECRGERSKDQTIELRSRVQVGQKYEDYVTVETIRALSVTPDLGRVPDVFCQALDDLLYAPKDFCVGIMRARQYWPTYDGWVTLAWSEQWPYPDPDAEDWTGRVA